MAINKPEIPSAELPEDWGGTQTPYTEQQTQEGYPEAIPTVIDGGNLNYEKRGVFKNIKYLRVFSDWLRNMPIGKIPVVNSKGQLDYGQPVLLASDEEYIDGQTIEKSPTVKQVRDSFTDIDGKISNCITEIPQDIKLELVDGVLTLKTGSAYYMPDGTKHIIPSDKTSSGQISLSEELHLICIRPTDNVLRFRHIINCVSGAGAKTKSGFAYDTTTNKIGYYNSQGELQEDNCSLPIAIVRTDSSGYMSSIYQVFNGFGYIGSTVFALPGVKGLIPNGRNSDGTLKNIEFVTNKVQTFTYSSDLSQNGYIYLILGSNTLNTTRDYSEAYTFPDNPRQYTSFYNVNENILYKYDGTTWVRINNFMIAGTVYNDSNLRITSLTPKLPFRAVDQNDFNNEVKKLELNMPAGSILPFAGQTAPSGFLICDGSAISRTTYADLFAVIGTTYGTGNGSTTFNLPNFVNKTFWGGTSSGTVKSAGLPNITGNYGAVYKGNSGVTGTTDGAFNMDGTFNSKLGSGGASDDWGGQFSFNASRSSSIYGNADTVQPPAIQTLICIKY